MAIGKHSGATANLRPTVFLSLSHGEQAGFRQYVQGEDSGERASLIHSDISGRIIGFRLKEELTGQAAKEYKARGQNPNKVNLEEVAARDKQWVGVLRLRDDEPAEPDLVLSFKVEDSLGGKLLGMLHTLQDQGKIGRDVENPESVAIAAFYRAPHSRYNNTDKGRDSINAWPTELPRSQDNYIRPTFMNADGSDYHRDENGNVSSYLPMGVQQNKGTKNEFWDHSARDDILLATAVKLAEGFARPENTDSDQQNDADGVDMAEAAAAAAAPTA